MKKLLTIALIMTFILSVSGTMALAAYKDGEYIGVVENEKYGHTVIAVSIVKGYIANVEIINQVKFDYPYEQGKEAYLQFPQQVIQKQDGNIDALAGATSSYSSYNEALNIALDIASGTYTGNTFYGLSRDYAYGHVVLAVTLNEAKDKIVEARFITANPAENMKKNEALAGDKSKGYPYEPGQKAFTTFPEKVVNAQSVHIDTVAGATHSNTAYYQALMQALGNAGVARNFE